MSKRLFHVKELVRGGIHQAEALAEQVLWVDGNNVIASERALRPILGHSAFLPSLSAEPITGLFEVSLGGFNNLFIASETKLIRFIEDANLTFYDVSSTPVAISRDSIWSLEEFGGRVFGCSGEAGDAIRYFPDDGTLAYDATKTMGPNAAGEFAQLVGTSIFKTLNVHLLAFAPDLDKKSFLWCDAGDGMTWIPTTTNAAGGIYIRDLEGDIAAVHNLASGLGVYGEEPAFLCAVCRVSELFHGSADPFWNRCMVERFRCPDRAPELWAGAEGFLADRRYFDEVSQQARYPGCDLLRYE